MARVETHDHLHRLVEAREDDMNRDHMTHFQKLSGIRPTLPSLEESASNLDEGQTYKIKGLSVKDMGDPSKVMRAIYESLPIWLRRKQPYGKVYLAHNDDVVIGKFRITGQWHRSGSITTMLKENGKVVSYAKGTTPEGALTAFQGYLNTVINNYEAGTGGGYDVQRAKFYAPGHGVMQKVGDVVTKAAIESVDIDLIEAEMWVQGAIQKPGRLRAHFGVKKGEKIPLKDIKKAYNELKRKKDKSAEEISLMRAMALGIRLKGGDVPGGEKKKGLRGESDGFEEAASRKKTMAQHMWVLSKDGIGGAYLVTIGDPRKHGSTIKARFSGPDAKQELKLWVRDNVGRSVSPNHVLDTTGMRLVSDEYTDSYMKMMHGEGIEEATGWGVGYDGARMREDAIFKAITKLFGQYKVPLDTHRLHIDSRGEITVASKGAEKFRTGYQSKVPKKWPKALVAKLSAAGLTHRSGMSPQPVRPNDRPYFVTANHFVWENVLLALGALKIPKSEDLDEMAQFGGAVGWRAMDINVGDRIVVDTTKGKKHLTVTEIEPNRYLKARNSKGTVFSITSMPGGDFRLHTARGKTLDVSPHGLWVSKKANESVDLDEGGQTTLADLQARLKEYKRRSKKNPGLWDDEIRDTKDMIKRLKAGKPFTKWQRGIPESVDLDERQKGQPVLTFPSEEKPQRLGAFKVSTKILDLLKKETGYTPDRLLFKQHQRTILDIPRDDLPRVMRKDNMADAQDVIAMKPRQAFQLFLQNIGKVSPKAGKLIRAIPENNALLFYIYMMQVSGRDMADIILKRYLSTTQAFKPIKPKKESVEARMSDLFDMGESDEMNEASKTSRDALLKALKKHNASQAQIDAVMKTWDDGWGQLSLSGERLPKALAKKVRAELGWRSMEPKPFKPLPGSHPIHPGARMDYEDTVNLIKDAALKRKLHGMLAKAKNLRDLDAVHAELVKANIGVTPLGYKHESAKGMSEDGPVLLGKTVLAESTNSFRAMAGLPAQAAVHESVGLNASQVSPDDVKMRYAPGAVKGSTIPHIITGWLPSKLPGYANYIVDFGGKRINLALHTNDNMAFDGNFKYPVYYFNPRNKWELVSLLKNKPEVFKALGRALKKEFSAETAATRGMMGGYEPQAY